MKFRQTLLLATASLAALTAAAQADVKVIASIKPVHSLVAAVMEGAGEPSLIVDGAGSPHNYSLKPSQARALQDADLIFWIGDKMETFLDKPIDTLGDSTETIALIDTRGLIKLGFREGGAFEKHTHDDHGDDHDHEDEHAEANHDHEDGHGDHDHDHEGGHDHEEDHAEADHDHDQGEIDMHVWLDPMNAKAMAQAIAEKLAEADPDNAELYEKNAAALSERIDALTTGLQAELEPLHDTGYIVFHDAYQYFENRFGLTPAGSITVTPDVMPGADRLKEIQAKVRELDATCVFTEPQFEPKLVSVALEGTEARSGVLDPLGAEFAAGPDLYFDVLRGMAASFRTCLAGDS